MIVLWIDQLDYLVWELWWKCRIVKHRVWNAFPYELLCRLEYLSVHLNNNCGHLFLKLNICTYSEFPKGHIKVLSSLIFFYFQEGLPNIFLRRKLLLQKFWALEKYVRICNIYEIISLSDLISFDEILFCLGIKIIKKRNLVKWKAENLKLNNKLKFYMKHICFRKLVNCI